MENKVKTKESRKYVFRDLIEMVEVRRLFLLSEKCSSRYASWQ